MGWDPKTLTSREHIKDQIRAGEQGRWPGVVALAGQLGEAVPGQGGCPWVGGLSMGKGAVPGWGGCLVSGWAHITGVDVF